MFKYSKSSNTVIMTTSALALLASCTSYDDTPTPEEAANQAAAAAYQSQSGDLSFGADGTLSFKGQKLTVTDTVSGQNSYANINVDGLEYVLVTANTEWGTAIYALNSTNQFADIGHTVDAYTNPTQAASVNYGGTYFERTLGTDGSISTETSGGILLELDAGAGTLTSLSGPNVSYAWDDATGNFVGAGNTQGQAVIYTNEELLGTYQNAQDDGSTDFGAISAYGG